jgi:hypothetical protein
MIAHERFRRWAVCLRFRTGTSLARSQPVAKMPAIERSGSATSKAVFGRSCLAALLAAPKAAVSSDLMPRSPVPGHVSPVNQGANGPAFLVREPGRVRRPSTKSGPVGGSARTAIDPSAQPLTY